jgi:hypothetical protein
MGRTCRMHGHNRNADEILIGKLSSQESPGDLKFKVLLQAPIFFFLAISEFPKILRNPKLHYTIQKNLSLVLILGEINSAPLPIIFIRTTF